MMLSTCQRLIINAVSHFTKKKIKKLLFKVLRTSGLIKEISMNSFHICN